MATQSTVRACFDPDFMTADLDEIQRQRIKCGDQLLQRINRLLRWYRSVSRQADITELTRAQVSPFLFEAIGDDVPIEWIAPLEYEAAGPEPNAMTLEQMSKAVRDGLSGGNDPDVSDLFLLDAERSLHEGRFREAVLFCWSTIDSVFNRRYDTLVDQVLGDEWSNARDFFKGFDFGLRNKMSVGMRFLANRSLFHEQDDLWNRLSTSYSKRNAIIHQGANATEEDAKLAIEVAKTTVEIMRAV